MILHLRFTQRAQQVSFFTLMEMEEQELISYAEDGSVILPVGYRFDPTDEVLVSYYLKKKIYDQPVPVQVIQEFDVFQTEPWNLPGDRNVFKERKYFFLDMRGRRFENIDKRVAGNGEWRTVEKDKGIILPNKNFMGKKNTLAFWEIQGNAAVKTRWMMHEFRFSFTAHPAKVAVWNAYRIFQKKEAKVGKKKGKGKKGKGKKGKGSTKATVIDLNVENDNGSVSGPPSPMTP